MPLAQKSAHQLSFGVAIADCKCPDCCAGVLEAAQPDILQTEENEVAQEKSNRVREEVLEATSSKKLGRYFFHGAVDGWNSAPEVRLCIFSAANQTGSYAKRR